MLKRSGKKLDLERATYFVKGEYCLRLKFNNVFPALAILQVKNTEDQPVVYNLVPCLDNRLYTRVKPDIKKAFIGPITFIYLRI